MLNLRIITAVILAPAFLLFVLYLDTFWFALVMAAVIALAAWEWAGVSGYSQTLSRAGYTVFILLLLGAVYEFKTDLVSVWLITFALVWWLVAFGLVLRYQKFEESDFSLPIPAIIMGILVLVPPWLSLIVLRADEPDGVKSVLFLLVLIWSADIAAYFSGRRWGKNKLCNRVSPGKSWEGVFGALVAAAGMGLVYAIYQGMQGTDVLIFITISLFTVLASILGDLLESLMKRLGNVKDSGTILPGHGGILDRIDSLTAALPVFCAALWLWEKSI
ncbi:MAG: phosphatidate cytidylyltransferase [Gammaproteobacteria bacterium]|jgi:phosphatidate cytidylyltransferase